MAAHQPVLLDISRTISRAGRGPDTGIDRVERAYTRWAQTRPNSGYLARLGRKVALIPQDEAANLFLELETIDADRHWPLGRLLTGRNPRDRRAERIVARHAQAIALPENLGPALRRSFPDGFSYINVGHTNLFGPNLAALKEAGARQVLVLLHDAIPLTHSGTQTTKSVTRFRNRLNAAGQEATHLITSAQSTAETIRPFLPKSAPAFVPIPLGVEPAPDVPAHVQERPYFVQLGTVEPRKNTELLLDAWQLLPNPRPELQVIGAKGWLSDRIFKRMAEQSADVTHLENLTDRQITARLKGAQALLFPSLAEGFGFPLFEAAQLETPILASDLPVFRELMPHGPLYLKPDDVTTWSQQIEQRGSRGMDRREEIPPDASSIPRWDEHFDRLETLILSCATAPG